MAYQALYRRLRPQSFDAVIGQRHIVKTLKNQIASGHISHAYLFCGTRGTGKTSMAKIFARAINCTSDGERPCNECDVCKSILNGSNVNVVEIDAASNNGVENIRDIIDEAKFPPTVGKCRVYIIDEVHMLSVNAFNALLKTLEEPPAHVVFVLATTDPQKLLPTVLSRCQRFDFHRIGLKDMTDVLMQYMRDEGVDADEEALSYIAEVSDGAMRDALSLLDMCMSFYYDERITAEKVRAITGAADRSIFFDLTGAIAQNDGAAALDIVEQLIQSGRDIQQFAGDCMQHFRDLLVARTVRKACPALDRPENYINKLVEQADKLPYEYILNLINLFSELKNNMKYSNDRRIMLEVACIKACTPLTDQSNAALEKRLINVEQKLENGVIPAAPAAVKAAEPPRPVITVEKSVPDDIKAIIKHWNDFTGIIDDKVAYITLASQTQPAYLEDNYLTIVCDHASDLNTVNKKNDKITDYLREYSGKDFSVRAMMRADYDKRHTEKYGAKDDTLKESEIEDQLKQKINFDMEIQ